MHAKRSLSLFCEGNKVGKKILCKCLILRIQSFQACTLTGVPNDFVLEAVISFCLIPQ